MYTVIPYYKIQNNVSPDLVILYQRKQVGSCEKPDRRSAGKRPRLHRTIGVSGHSRRVANDFRRILRI